MMTEQQQQQQQQQHSLISNLLTVEERISTAGHWVTPLREALADVTSEEAEWKAAPGERAIREMTRHLTTWVEWSANLLRTGEDTPVTEWPEEDKTADWSVERERLFAALTAFREAIAALGPDTTFAPASPGLPQYSRFLAVNSILAHNAYHAGQIVVLLREIRRSLSPSPKTP
jgi:hypothetical protein